MYVCMYVCSPNRHIKLSRHFLMPGSNKMAAVRNAFIFSASDGVEITVAE